MDFIYPIKCVIAFITEICVSVVYRALLPPSWEVLYNNLYTCHLPL